MVFVGLEGFGFAAVACCEFVGEVFGRNAACALTSGLVVGLEGDMRVFQAGWERLLSSWGSQSRLRYRLAWGMAVMSPYWLLRSNRR